MGSLLHTAPAQIVDGQLTGIQKSESIDWQEPLRFVERDGLRILQQRYEVHEYNHDEDSTRSWKEWRDVPLVLTEPVDETPIDEQEVIDAEAEHPDNAE